MRNWLWAVRVVVGVGALVIGLVGSSGRATAQTVDYFVVQLSGLEHCADFDNFKFGSRNSDPMYLRIVDHQEWDLSSNPIFTEDETTPIIGETYLVSTKKQA